MIGMENRIFVTKVQRLYQEYWPGESCPWTTHPLQWLYKTHLLGVWTRWVMTTVTGSTNQVSHNHGLYSLQWLYKTQLLGVRTRWAMTMDYTLWGDYIKTKVWRLDIMVLILTFLIHVHQSINAHLNFLWKTIRILYQSKSVFHLSWNKTTNSSKNTQINFNMTFVILFCSAIH